MYGLAENIGWHILLSNLFWWASVGIVLGAYKNRKIWNVGNAPWAFLLLTFVSFGIRELGHLTTDLFLGAARYVFGIWSALFMASAFVYLYCKMCLRKEPSKPLRNLPFAIMLVFPLLFGYLYYSGVAMKDIKNTLGTLEGVAWLVSSAVTVYATYLLGSRATGKFIRFYFLFNIGAYLAFLWKLLGLLNVESYGTREIIETLFGVFATASVYSLSRMLKDMANRVYGR